MRASLPMYNLPEMRDANGAFWSAIRTELSRQGLDAPEQLDVDRKPVPQQIEPDTLFTQVCGWPLQTIFAGQATILAVPIYAAPYCDGPNHRGVFVVAAASAFATLEDLRGTRFVFNSVHSNSGMNLPRRSIADIAGGRPFFASIEETHSQPANLERVARGDADATCVDCVTFAFFARHRPHLARQLRILAPTPPSPALPFVTAAATSPDIVEALRQALHNAARAPEWIQARAGLLMQDVVLAFREMNWGVQSGYAREAEAHGYPTLI